MKIILGALILFLAQQAPAQTSDVAGRVLRPDNTPAAAMTVELLQLVINKESVREWHPVERGVAITDARGNFRIAGVRPGQYYLRAIKRPQAVSGISSTASSIDWTPTTYFPGTLNAALASPLTVSTSQSVTADIPIPQTNPYTVSGRIVNSLPEVAGRPIQLVLMRRDYGAPVETQSASLETMNLPVGGDGKFEIRGVPSGSYELLGTVSGVTTTPGPTGPNRTWIARASFDVSDQDIDNVLATFK